MDTKSARSKSAGTRSGVNPLKLKAQDLLKRGVSFREVAGELDLSDSTIRQWAKDGKWERGVDLGQLKQISKKQEAQRLVEEGVNFADAARQLEVSPTAIQDWAKAGGWKRGVDQEKLKQISKKQEAQILVEEGVNFSEIARRFEVTPTTITNWAIAGGWERGRQQEQISKKLEAQRLVEGGANFSETARQLGQTPYTIRNWAKSGKWKRPKP